MLNLRNQIVNVDRFALLAALREGLAAHTKQYREARAEYELAVVQFMSDALVRAKAGNFKDLVLRLPEPQNHAAEYRDIIEMLEVSVDETIQLDKESYKAFYRNEWSWQRGFLEASSLYKTAIAGARPALGGALA